MQYIYHHGIEGQKWGVRRYQYADGSLTPAGRERYGAMKGQDGVDRTMTLVNMRVSEAVKSAKTIATGKQYVDSYLSKGTTLARIQTSKEFEKYAFYATYKKQDMDKYLGLFGKNLTDRAKYAARKAEKDANVSGSEEDLALAKELRGNADNMQIYQLKLEATSKLKIPSDENAGDITAKLLKESQFKSDLEASIRDSSEKMKRPSQQILFRQARNALNKNPEKLTASEKVAIYKAFNLSLTNHNPQQISAQNRFYGELKKKGYDALLDYNDKEYSSYHAKRPMIVFNTDSVKLRSVTQADSKIVDKLYVKYNTERIAKELFAETIGLVQKYGAKTTSECQAYIKDKIDEYLRQNE